MGFADGKDLLKVMLSVNELKLSPLIYVERPQDCVAGKLAGGPEEFLGFGAEKIKVGQMFGGGRSELLAAERMSCRSWRDHGRGLPSVREVAETDEGILA